ncbi:MAG: hypothetical protein ACW98Y_02035 [Candidatus Thorarchaeota archaeon]|jgi:hypothetical protein
MSEEIKFKDLILYLSAVALVLFYLVYMPWTAMSALTFDGVTLWLYYFTLVLGLLFPLYYAIGREDMAWFVLGLSLILNSVILMMQPAATNFMLPGVFTLLVGVLFFLGPILEKMMADNWKMIKNFLHMGRGLFMFLAVGAYANWTLDDFVGNVSFNHAMPQFLFLGGGLFAAFGIVLFTYGLFKFLADFLPDKIGVAFKDLASIFYILMVLVFLLGITFNVQSYAPLGFVWDYWGGQPFPTSIGFFADMWAVGSGNLGAILLIILFIYGMMKIVAKNVKEEDQPVAMETV